MILDSQLSFVPIGAPLSLVAGGGIAIPSTNIIDLLGQGAGTAPNNIIGQSVSTFGTDMGVGGLRPELNIVIGTTLTAAAGTTLKVALQAAQDLGTPTYQPGSWSDIDSQDGITLANATAGAVIFRSPWLPTMPPGFLPRFLRLLFSPQLTNQTPNGNFTAGTILSATVTMVRDDQANKYAGKNFKVA